MLVTIFGFTHHTGNVPILHYPYLFCIMQYSDHACMHTCFMHKQNPHSLLAGACLGLAQLYFV